jgi:hypothetical protein
VKNQLYITLDLDFEPYKLQLLGDAISALRMAGKIVSIQSGMVPDDAEVAANLAESAIADALLPAPRNPAPPWDHAKAAEPVETIVSAEPAPDPVEPAPKTAAAAAPRKAPSIQKPSRERPGKDDGSIGSTDAETVERFVQACALGASWADLRALHGRSDGWTGLLKKRLKDRIEAARKALKSDKKPESISIPERAAVADPEPKPLEPVIARGVEGAGSSSETNARQSVAADRRPSGPALGARTTEGRAATRTAAAPSADEVAAFIEKRGVTVCPPAYAVETIQAEPVPELAQIDAERPLHYEKGRGWTRATT